MMYGLDVSEFRTAGRKRRREMEHYKLIQGDRAGPAVKESFDERVVLEEASGALFRLLQSFMARYCYWVMTRS